MEPTTPTEPFFTKPFVALCLALLLLTGVTFFPALENGFITAFDDQGYVTANPEVQKGLTLAGLHYALTGVVSSNWHPLTILSHMLDCQLYGLDPWGHHLTSVLFHAANVLLLFALLCKLTGALYRSFFVAVFFGLHPLRVESVAWVSERKDVLSTFFALLAVLCYLKYVRTQVDSGIGTTRSTQRLFYGLTLLFFVLGLLAKPMIVTLPCVLLLLDFWPLQRWEKKSVRWLLVEKIPLLMASAVFSVATVFVQKTHEAVISLASLPLSARIETTFVGYAGYLEKIFWPAKLCMIYPYPNHWPVRILAVSIGLLAMVSIGVAWVRQKQPWLLMGWLWFLGTLVPVIGLVQVSVQTMADRYTYLPSVGIFIGVVWSVSALAARRRVLAGAVCVLATFLALTCVVLTRNQIQYWKNNETLFRHAVLVTENNYVAEDLLGRELSRQNRFEEAVGVLKEAVRADPVEPGIRYDLAVNLEHAGQLDEACAEYRTAVSLDPTDVESWNKLGMGLVREGKPGEAITAFTAALKLNPQSADLHYNLGNALVRTGRLPEAVEQFQMSLALNPGDAGTHNNLGVVFFNLHRWEDAVNEFKTALRLDPGNSEAKRNLESALKVQDRMNPFLPPAR